ncbi:CotS family spore coat protein [Blautia sp. Sow4_E7]|uniref:CotS family spore coat protein n=1 Tax=Blautia sp. Sow4_E7 TaxID=3438749 RepID=UPI003F8FBE58
MYDYGLSTLTQYGMEAKSSSRTRGALVCRTDQGLLILREFHGSEKKLLFQQELLKKLSQEGCLVDTFLENQEGSLVTRDKDNIPYTLQKWYEGRECDTKSREDIARSVQTLAKIHKSMNMPVEAPYVVRPLTEEYARHNREIRKIRKFIRQKGASVTFEKAFLGSVQRFLEKGEKALEMLSRSDYEKLLDKARKEGALCHGEYNQHNVLLGRNQTAVTNFGHFGFDVQISDLYCFMRKILEKYNWDVSLALKMLEQYHKVRPISPEEWENLKIRFTYPEKYWKLANYYISHRKAWISGKNTEKLEKVIGQLEIWGDFPEKCFGKYPF